MEKKNDEFFSVMPLIERVVERSTAIRNLKETSKYFFTVNKQP